MKNMKDIQRDPAQQDVLQNQPYFEGFLNLIESEIIKLADFTKERTTIPKFEKKGMGIVSCEKSLIS
jgi:hypothetical protein